MKKIKLMIGCTAFALAAVALAACDGRTSGEETVHTVTFQTAWGGVPDSQEVSLGGKAVKPADPDRVGWTFDGWYLGDVLYTFEEAVTTDITLVARYSSVLGGSGTELDPFTVDNAAEFVLFAGYVNDGAQEFVTAHYVQTADITLNATSVTEFKGAYDGGGHKIATDGYLFDALDGATVKDINFVGSATVEIDADSVGAIARTAKNSTISGAKVSASLKTTRKGGVAGGVVGVLDGGRIEYSYADVTVVGDVAGGIAGESSGATVNNAVVVKDISGGDVAGGAVGTLKAGGLVQNAGIDIGADGNGVSATAAGGIVGKKQADSAVYHAFVYGDGSIVGVNAGGIAGVNAAGLGEHTDVAESYVLGTLNVDAGEDKTTVHGEVTADDLTALVLPAAVWNVSGAHPELRSTLGNAPATVAYIVDGRASTIAYGGHVDGELFTQGGGRFSKLIEADTDLDLRAAPRINLTFGGSAFDAGEKEVSFTVGKTTLGGSGASAKELTYVNTFGFSAEFIYTPDFSNPSTAYPVSYFTPVTLYRDGENYIAFVVEKQQIQSGYVAFLESYSYDATEKKWKHADSWYPKADGLPVGAYTYTTAFALGSRIQHFVVIDDAYRVEDGEGFYRTRYMQRVIDVTSESYTDGDFVTGIGQTVMFLGDSENNAPTTALAFSVNYDGYVDFIYKDESGKWVNSTGSEVTGATEEYLGGEWFDGTSKYVFRKDTGKVTVTTAEGSAEFDYAITDNAVVIDRDGKTQTFVVAPTDYGAYKLVCKQTGEALTLATYVSDAFDGRWITENGDIIVAGSSPAASITFNGTVAERVTEDVYNGVQSLLFTVNGNEYNIVKYLTEDTVLLIKNSVAVRAYAATAVVEKFTGSFVAVADGVRYELNITDDLDVSLDLGGAAKSGKAAPFKTDDGIGDYGLTVTVDDKTYTLVRTDDVITLSEGETVLTYTDAETFARFVGEYTNGTETLVITENGTFTRTANGETAGTPVALDSEYRAERVIYGGEKRGYVLTYTVGEQTYFFYADKDAHNIRLYYVYLDRHGNEVVRHVNNFVPEAELAPVYGTYERDYNNAVDSLTFSAEDGRLTRRYTDSDGKEQSKVIDWFPIINYNSNTGNTNIIVRTIEVEADNTTFESTVEFTLMGLTWAGTSYVNNALSARFNPFMSVIYTDSENTLIEIEGTRFNVTFLKTDKDGEYATEKVRFNFDSIVMTDNDITLQMTEGGLSVENPRSATAVLTEDGGTYKVSFAIADGEQKQFTGESILDYNTLVGDYVYDGTTYSFAVEESWFGTSITLKYKEGSSNRQFTYSESNPVAIMSDGSQAIPLYYNRYGYRYVWKVGDNLMISDSVDVSKAIAAMDSAFAGMPSIDGLQSAMDGEVYTAADGATVTFELVNSVLGGGTYFDIIVGENEGVTMSSYERGKGVYTLVFFDDATGVDTYAFVYVNAIGAVTKVAVGDTNIASDAKEYLPEFVLPTVDELKELLRDKAYEATDKSVVMFIIDSTWMGDYYTMILNGANYDYVNGSYVEGVYKLVFKNSFSVEITISVTYTQSGLQKITIGDKDYTTLVALPTTDELQSKLDGMTFEHEYYSDTTIAFTLTEDPFGMGSQLNISMVEDGNTVAGALDKITQNDNEYTLEFTMANGTKVTLTVKVLPDGSVNVVSYDDYDYNPVEA